MRVKGLLFDGIEMGFNLLTGVDYAGYPAETADFLDLRAGNSFHFGVTPIGLAVRLDRRGKFEFATGLRYTVNNYRLSDNTITLGREDGLIVPVTLDERADKSKLRTTSLGIPLQFSFDPVRKLRIAVCTCFFCHRPAGTRPQNFHNRLRSPPPPQRNQ